MYILPRGNGDDALLLSRRRTDNYRGVVTPGASDDGGGGDQNDIISRGSASLSSRLLTTIRRRRVFLFAAVAATIEEMLIRRDHVTIFPEFLPQRKHVYGTYGKPRYLDRDVRRTFSSFGFPRARESFLDGAGGRSCPARDTSENALIDCGVVVPPPPPPPRFSASCVGRGKKVRRKREKRGYAKRRRAVDGRLGFRRTCVQMPWPRYTCCVPAARYCYLYGECCHLPYLSITIDKRRRCEEVSPIAHVHTYSP